MIRKSAIEAALSFYHDGAGRAARIDMDHLRARRLTGAVKPVIDCGP